MIRDILITQKRELESKLKELCISRSVGPKKIDSPLIKIIIGPRRAGKSFFAIHFLGKKGSNFGYVNFDDERLVETKNYDDIINAVDSVYNNPKDLLFDEIQNLAGWELFVNRLYRQGYNLFLTGSNSNLLSRELASHLTGRHAVINIPTFSFGEFLRADGKELTDSEKKAKLAEYIIYGGYPEPLVKKIDYKEYISTLINSIIYKDIVKRYKIRFAQGIEDLATYLFSNIAKEFSFNQLSRVTKVKSPHTVEKYEGYLEEVYLFLSLRMFSYKVKEQLASNKKIYSTDNGLIYAKAFQVSPDTGRLYENAVANELVKRGTEDDFKVYYYKNAQQEEVDFVVRKGNKTDHLIQVCYDIKNHETKKREVRALLKAGRELNCNELLIINDDFEGEEDAEWFGVRGRVKYIPLWRWLCA